MDDNSRSVTDCDLFHICRRLLRITIGHSSLGIVRGQRSSTQLS